MVTMTPNELRAQIADLCAFHGGLYDHSGVYIEIDGELHEVSSVQVTTDGDLCIRTK